MIENIYSPELIRIDISDRTEDEPFMLQSGEFCLAETLELFNLLTTSAAISTQKPREKANHLLLVFATRLARIPLTLS